MINILYVILKL